MTKTIEISDATNDFLRRYCDYHDCPPDDIVSEALMYWILIEEITAVRMGDTPPTDIGNQELLDSFGNTPLD